VLGRGADLRIATEGDVPLAESPCVGCGACVDTCPTAALTDASAWREPPATTWTRTTCPYCGVGCELDVGVGEDRIVATRPVLDAPVSKGNLCVKGRYAHAYVDAPDRVTTPQLRRDGHWRSAGWDEAIAFAADGLRRIATEHGPDAIGVLGSSRATNEENYLTQKFARIAIGTNNVDCCARVCHTPSAAALKHMLGTGAATNSFDDIEQAAGFLVVGANPLENHPVIGARIRQQVRRGAALVVVDPRRTALAAIADVHLALRPGTNVPLLNALAQVLFAEDLLDRDFLAARVDGVAPFARARQ
jgi:formate dehydrogenase major subunit